MRNYEFDEKDKIRESLPNQMNSHVQFSLNTGGADLGSNSTSDPDQDEDVARSGIVELFASTCRRRGQWNFEGADLIPELLTLLPAWQRSGVILVILENEHNPVILPSTRNHLADGPAIILRRVNRRLCGDSGMKKNLVESV